MIVGQNQLSVLDNPVWNPPSTTHASFAEGDELAKRYPVDVAPFAATRDQSTQSYDSLAQVIGPGGTAALPLATMPELPAGWIVLRKADATQMVWNGSVLPPPKHGIEDLNLSDIDEMLALVELTKPGPSSDELPNWEHISESMKQANLWLWPGNESDHLDTLKSALYARILSTAAENTPAPLSRC